MRRFLVFLAGGVVFLAILSLAIMLVTPQSAPTETNVAPGETEEAVQSPPKCWTEEELVVSGTSMEPLLSPGEKVILLRGYYACNKVKRGDLVAIALKTLPQPIVKRVVAVPGDVLEERNGYLYVNGSPVTEITLALQIPLEHYGWKLPPNTIIVLSASDNGLDSRRFGPISMNQVLGKVIKEVNQ